MREDFRVYSDVFHFRVDTVPLVMLILVFTM